MENKEYLGDGVYAADEGSGIRLTTENGVIVYDTIFLEPWVLSALVAYATRIKSKHRNR